MVVKFPSPLVGPLFVFSLEPITGKLEAAPHLGGVRGAGSGEVGETNLDLSSYNEMAGLG